MQRRSFRPLASRMRPLSRSGETKPAIVMSDEDLPQRVIRSVKVMLFADAEGFTKVSEELTPVFVEKFLGGISNGLATLSKPPAFVNTWGDSFFAVFDDLDDALSLAVHLRDYFSKEIGRNLG